MTKCRDILNQCASGLRYVYVPELPGSIGKAEMETEAEVRSDFDPSIAINHLKVSPAANHSTVFRPEPATSMATAKAAAPAQSEISATQPKNAAQPWQNCRSSAQPLSELIPLPSLIGYRSSLALHSLTDRADDSGAPRETV
jgi:hypothetical protein